MKLILCPDCQDVKKIRTEEIIYCYCGNSWGKYLDDLHAEIGGKAIPIGFGNYSLVSALKNRPEEDNGSGGKFEAFVIPKGCKTIKEES